VARIVPFPGLRYAAEKVGDLATVVTPPYDVIDATAQERYHQANPANIIRLELGKQYPQDQPGDDRYSRAAAQLQDWIASGVLRHEPAPSIYLYQQEFSALGRTLVRNGLLCGLGVEPYSTGTVLPHEETLSKPKQDRLQLMRATACNFSPIFGLYVDPQQQVNEALFAAAAGRQADVELTDEFGEQHRLWVITDANVITQVQAILAPAKIYIADGHHRYETALAYAAEQKAGYDYIMITLVNMYDPGLVVLPTHRMVKDLHPQALDGFRARLDEFFHITPCPERDLEAALAKAGQHGHAFAMCDQDGLSVLVLRDVEKAQKLLPGERSQAWRELDVAILDNLILEHLLGITAQKRREQVNLTYTRDIEQAIAAVQDKSYQLAFFLNPPAVSEVIAVAEAQDKMPQKSTFFYPKLITGLVINDLAYAAGDR
jgi:uncharacterized protein (DUF1015 family)